MKYCVGDLMDIWQNFVHANLLAYWLTLDVVLS